MFGSLGGEFPIELGDGDALPGVLHSELLSSYGSAFSQERGGALWIHCYAEAMTLYAAYCASAAALAQHTPGTATDLLDAWEDQLGLYGFGVPIAQRQDNAAQKFSMLGMDVMFNGIDNALRDALGETYVAIRPYDYETVLMTVPDNSYPWGNVDPLAPWTSSFCHLAIELQQGSLTDGQLMEKVGILHEVLAPRVNAWVTYGWFLFEGFVLDEDNLDVAAFDSND